DEDQQAVLVGRNPDFEPACELARKRLELNGAPLGHGALEGFMKGGLLSPGNHAPEVPAEQRLMFFAQKLRALGADIGQPPIFLEEQERLVDHVEQLGPALLLVARRPLRMTEAQERL